MFPKFVINLFIIILISNLCSSATKDIEVSCKNEKGENVDWFYVYKLPANHSGNKNSQADKAGFNYAYLTSASYNDWTFSSTTIDEFSSITASTLQPLNDNPSVLLLGYNDEFPNGQVISGGGHTKGVVATDGETGIWLIHSVPKFPSIPNYEYPSTGAHYGQSILCVTFNATQMDKVGKQLLFNEPSVYFERLPVGLKGKFPNLELVLQKKWIADEPFNNVLDLISLEGSKFKSFAKNSKFNKELYEDLVAPTLDCDLLVEAWRNGKGNLDSNCSLSDKVYNIKSLKWRNQNIEFRTTLDHSKWAVSKREGLRFVGWRFYSPVSWLCVGDINRQQHQLVRGGGVLCHKHKKLADLYRNLIDRYEVCTKSK